MKRALFLCLYIFITISIVEGQGIVRGKISDENGEPLTGATVYLQSDQSVGTITDFDGNFALEVPSERELSVIASFISYRTIEIKIFVQRNEVSVINLVMSPSAVEIEDVVITWKANKSNDMYMQLQKARAAVSMDYISSETIRKTGDSDIHDATKRITGVSTVGDFITVRGLADRYIKTTINGSRIPTLDPFTNNIELDIFPTSLVDNIVISKTMSPDLPGDWAGAYLSIETKDYPERLTIKVNTSFGYNEQTTFREILTSESGPLDWLAMDGGFRDITNPEPGDFPEYVSNPAPSAQFDELGIGSYFNALKVDPSLIQNTQDNIYFNLGLVELGILPAAQIYDAEAIKAARENYYSSVYVEAFESINSDLISFSESLSDNMDNVYSKAPFDHSQEFSIGNQFNMFGNPLGFIFGFRYHRGVRYDPASVYARGMVSAGTERLFKTDSLFQQVSSVTHGWSGLVQLSYKLNSNNSISLMFMPNLNGNNSAQKGSGILDGAESDAVSFTQSQIYEERRQLIYQARSRHYIPGIRMRVEANGSYTSGRSIIPDFKRMNWTKYKEGADTIYAFQNVGLPRRNFRYLYEDIFDGYLNAEIPISGQLNLSRKIRFGGAYQRSNRNYKQFEYIMAQNNFGFRIEDGDLNKYFDPENYQVYRQNEYSFVPLHYIIDNSFKLQGRNASVGYSAISAGYLMTDFNVSQRFRFSGGLRVEHTDMFSDMTLLLGEPRDSYDRQLVGAGNLTANFAEIDTVHFLPSLNLIYKVVSNENLTLNARANFSKSLARPSIREVTYSYVYDYEYRIHVLGNPELEIVEIDNYDLRFESLFKRGDNASLSLFYKSFLNHIEVVDDNNYYTWINAEDSRVFGLEFETKVLLLQNLELRANLTLINSLTRIDLGGPEIREQSMFGQAPYVVNSLLSYSFDRAGLSTSLGYNVQGPRLAVINRGIIPNILEQPRHLVDFKVSKALGQYFDVSVKIRNLLDSPLVRIYEGSDLVYDQYDYGRDLRLSLSYHLN